MAEYKLYINGELVNSSSGKTVDDIGPATGEPIAQVPLSSTEDVDRAVAAARAAYDDGRWSDLPHGARAAALEKLAMAVEAHAAELAELESQDARSEEHTSELQSLAYLVCRLLLEKKKRTRVSVAVS